MKKKILIVGNGANTYALAKKLSKEHEIFVTPSSDTLKEFCTVLDIREDNAAELLEFALENQIDMTIPVTQSAINSGIADLFGKNNQLVFAPVSKANELSSNKAQAKKVLYKLHIPTPKFGIFEKESIALDYLKNQKIPFIMKTNDLNSAVVLTSVQSAKTIINSIYIEKNKKLIIEDYVYGTPFSFYALTDGYKALPIGSSLNYRYSLDGDGGQITDGMGACVPNYKLSFNDEYLLMDNVIYPTLEYLESCGNPYLGIMGINGIKTEEGNLYILGWNSFLQDSDASAILNNINEDIYSLFESCANGSFSDDINSIRLRDGYSVSLVLKNKNKNVCENPIKGLEDLDDDISLVYYPNVTKNRYLEYNAPSGSVCVMTSYAQTVSSASRKVYSEAAGIDFDGIYYRKDICRIEPFS
ncbi:hypothetical protein IKQ21_07575 [bacterium]|nr:hypothetical protein [bacterium]